MYQLAVFTFEQLKIQNQTEKQMSILDGVVKSFQQRKNMIEKRIDLHNQGYHGSVRQKTNDKIHNKLNKRN